MPSPCRARVASCAQPAWARRVINSQPMPSDHLPTVRVEQRGRGHAAHGHGTAQHAPPFHQRGIRSIARRSHGGAKPRRSAAANNHIIRSPLLCILTVSIMLYTLQQKRLFFMARLRISRQPGHEIGLLFYLTKVHFFHDIKIML